MSTNSSLDLQRFYPAELEIVSIEEGPDKIKLHMVSKTKSFCCPKCGKTLHKLHATHHRTVQDLPILGKRVILDIRGSSAKVSIRLTDNRENFLFIDI